MSRHSTVLLVLVAMVAAASASLTCYNGSGNNVTPSVTNDPSSICIRYDFTCSPGDGSCTEQEAANQVSKTGYVTATQDLCNQMRANPILYRNVYCCSTDKCNAPIGGTSSGFTATPSIVSVAAVALYLAL